MSAEQEANTRNDKSSGEGNSLAERCLLDFLLLARAPRNHRCSQSSGNKANRHFGCGKKSDASYDRSHARHSRCIAPGRFRPIARAHGIWARTPGWRIRDCGELHNASPAPYSFCCCTQQLEGTSLKKSAPGSSEIFNCLREHDPLSSCGPLFAKSISLHHSPSLPNVTPPNRQ